MLDLMQLQMKVADLEAQVLAMRSAAGDRMFPAWRPDVGGDRPARVGSKSWELMKTDGTTIWLRPGRLIHNRIKYRDVFTASGNGTNIESTGLGLAYTPSIVCAKLNISGASTTLTLSSESDSLPDDTATVRYFPLWIFTQVNGQAIPVRPLCGGDIVVTVYQLLDGFDASKVQFLYHEDDGEMKWFDANVCFPGA